MAARTPGVCGLAVKAMHIDQGIFGDLQTPREESVSCQHRVAFVSYRMQYRKIENKTLR